MQYLLTENEKSGPCSQQLICIFKNVTERRNSFLSDNLPSFTSTVVLLKKAADPSDSFFSQKQKTEKLLFVKSKHKKNDFF